MGVLAWIHESSGVLPISVSGGEFNNRGISTFPLGDYPQGHRIAPFSPAERGRTTTNHGIRGVLPQQCGPTGIAVTDAPDCDAVAYTTCGTDGVSSLRVPEHPSGVCPGMHQMPDTAPFHRVPARVRPAAHVAAYRTKRHRQDGTALQATTSPRDSATGAYGRPPIPHTSKTRSKRESPMHTGFGCMGLVRSRSALGSN